MIEFLVVEPDRERAEWIRSDMKALFLREKRGYTLTTLFTYQGALTYLERSPSKYDVVLVSLEDELSARAVVTAVRKQSQRTTLIVLGGSFDALCRLLPSRPSAYFADPSQSDGFDRMALALYIEQARMKRSPDESGFFLVRSRGELERIPYSHIDFFESANRKIFLHSNKNRLVYEFNDRIDNIMAAIKAHLFIRCHQSFVVNLANVTKIGKTARRFIMASGKTVDISKRSLGDVTALFEEYAITGSL